MVSQTAMLNGCARRRWMAARVPLLVTKPTQISGYKVEVLEETLMNGSERILSNTQPSPLSSAPVWRAWTLFCERRRVWVVASLVALSSWLVTMGLLFLPVVLMLARIRSPLALNPESMPSYTYFILLGTSLWGAVFGSGFFYLGVLQVRGELTCLRDLFRGWGVVLPLFALNLLSGGIAIVLSGLPFGSLVHWLLRVPIAAVGMFWIPLMIDAKTEPIEALRSSWEIVRRDPIRAIGFSILVIAIGLSGLVAAGIGVIVTVPLAVLTACIVYSETFDLAANSSKSIIVK